MIYYLLKKRKMSNIKKGVMGGRKHINIVGKFECTSPNNIILNDYVYIGPNCKFYGSGRLTIGENVIIGNDVTILTTNHHYEGEFIPYDYTALNKDVIIHDNVWIASNCFILPGVEISEGAIVAGGSVVTKSIPYCEIWGGNPAKFIKMREVDRYEQLKRDNKKYLLNKYNG